jgi:uncharacterized protein (DUF58 family)
MNDEIRSKIKKIMIYTKRLTQSSLTGDYLSAFKGSGLEFDQLREYQNGDDIRSIDWNSTAKSHSLVGSSKMMVKQFVEERDRVIILAIDVSSSALFSSERELRTETIAQIAAALTFIATHNKDKVGALFFSDKIEKWIPPKKGKAHFGKIIETLFSIQPTGKQWNDSTYGTNLTEALRFLISLKKRNAILLTISDWITQDIDKYEKLLKVASIKFDFVGIRLLDRCEKLLPEFGIINMQDPETGELGSIDTRKNINLFLKTRQSEQEKLFKKYRIDLLDLISGKPFTNQMVRFFHKRIRKQI